MRDRLFLVTRRDLPAGDQASQLVHGMAEFAEKWPAVFREWKNTSNTIILKTVENETALRWLQAQAEDKDFVHVTFREPDLKNALTVVVIEPRGHRLMHGLPFALE